MPHKEISEELIKQAADISGSNSSFHVALKWADDYRLAGLTPIFYTDSDERMIFVTTEEKINGNFFN